MSDSSSDPGPQNLNLPLEWQYRQISAKHENLTDAMVYGKQHHWNAAKPMMNQKMVLDPPEVGKRYLFTQDGWRSYAYVVAEEFKPGVFLLKHKKKKENSLVMRKLCTIVYTLTLCNYNGVTFDIEVTNTHGETLWKEEKVHYSCRVEDVKTRLVDSGILDDRLTKEDIGRIKFVTTFAEEIPQELNLDIVQQAYEWHRTHA